MVLTKKLIVFFLMCILVISLGLKLYTIDFSLYSTGDTTSYVLNAVSYKYGDFSPIPHKSPGWPLIISPFYSFTDSNNFVEYVNIARALSIAISLATIFPMYCLARKFFPEKYSLAAAGLFAFEPHLNFNSGHGLSEPLYIFIIILSLYFILNNNNKFVYLSFLFAGLLWIVRWNGIIMLIVLSVIFFINFQKTPKMLPKYIACVAIFFLVVSPMLLQRYEQFGDPFYYSLTNNFFTGSFGPIQHDIVNRYNIEYTAFDYIDDNGILQFVNTFILTGMWNLLEQAIKISFPYLIVFIPFGIIFSLRAFDQNKKYIRANWVLLLILLGSMAISFAIIPERRHILFMYPFLIIFSTIAIQRFTEYGLSTFSFSKKQKNLVLFGIIAVLIISSSLFMLRFELTDKIEHQEKTNYAKFVNDNLTGKILEGGDTLTGLRYIKITEPEGIFKTYRNSNHVDPSITVGKYYLMPKQGDYDLTTIGIYASSLDELIELGEIYGLNYISINKNGVETSLYPYLSKTYENDYPYLNKVYDSEEKGFQKLKVRVFEIDYKKYHSVKGT